MLGGYIPTLGNVNLERGCIREAGWYTRRMQRVFAADSFRADGEKRNSFLPVSSGGAEGVRLCVAKVLLLFQVALEKKVRAKNTCFCTTWRQGVQ